MGNAQKITGVLVDLEKGVARKATIDKSLEGYYKALNCDCIDIVSRSIGGQGFDIICDDEALLKEFARPSAFTHDMQPMLFGNLFVVNYDGKGDVCSLRQGQIEHVLRYVRTVKNTLGTFVFLTKCDY